MPAEKVTITERGQIFRASTYPSLAKSGDGSPDAPEKFRNPRILAADRDTPNWPTEDHFRGEPCRAWLGSKLPIVEEKLSLSSRHNLRSATTSKLGCNKGHEHSSGPTSGRTYYAALVCYCPGGLHFRRGTLEHTVRQISLCCQTLNRDSVSLATHSCSRIPAVTTCG